MSTFFHRFIALFLALTLLLGIVPTAFATETDLSETEETEMSALEHDDMEFDAESDNEDLDSFDDQEDDLEIIFDDIDLDDESEEDFDDFPELDEAEEDPVDDESLDELPDETPDETPDEIPDEPVPSEESDEPEEPDDSPEYSEETDEIQQELNRQIEALYDDIQYMIWNDDHAYAVTLQPTDVYENSNMDHVIFTLSEPNTILLATEFQTYNDHKYLFVWFVDDQNELVGGYIDRDAADELALLDEDAFSYTAEKEYLLADFGFAILPIFKAEGFAPGREIAVPDIPVSEPEQTVQEPIQEDKPEIPEEIPEEVPLPEETPETETIEEPDHEIIPDPSEPEPEIEDSENPEEENPDDSETEPTDVEEFPDVELEEDELPIADESVVSIGDYVQVFTSTRVYLKPDETVSDDYDGDGYEGRFVQDAIVQVMDILLDDADNEWYEVSYLYGDYFADGSIKWTDRATLFVLSSETQKSDSHDLTITDYAKTAALRLKKAMMLRAAGTTPMDGFTLKSINAPISPLTAGMTGIHGDSGRDSEYLQIASAPGKGTIYATPHYLDGYTVYCLEHTLDGPGEGSGSNKRPTGPYVIVDIDTYMNTPGNSRVIYSDSTMHAIAWVLRHTYPFMVLNRSDADNETWSRVAGQFAIRQVIREMEGAQYVRDYWNMDNFYVASGQAPSVYLTYARWLATNGIARGRITGQITVSNKSVARSGNSYVGTVTLSTDADLIRIAKSSSYTVSGNSGGSNSSNYLLNSGDTIIITSSINGFTVTAESVNSDEEEASFLVGVPSVQIQKVLIPKKGFPYKMQSKDLEFEVVIQYGDLTITKKRDRGDERVLSGAVFQLYNSANQAVGSPVTTNSNGTASWTHLEYGDYYIVETTAPAGYVLSSSHVSVPVNAATVTYTVKNTPIIGSVKLIKKEDGKDIPLVGAKYELVTKSGSTYRRALNANDGTELPVLTTDRNGSATWSNVVEKGDYYVHEIQPPEGYLIDPGYYAVKINSANEIVTSNVKDPIIHGKIKIVKKDQLTKEPLAGAVFTITRLSAPASHNGAGVGEVVATLTTGANGEAETGWLEYGRYEVKETTVPVHFVDNHFSTIIECYENNKTYTITVENEPTKGYIKIVKTDSLDRTPIEGVQFDIYYNDQYGSGLAGTMTTNEEGYAVSPALRKGKYIVKEHGDPTGYTTELITLDAVVKSDETTNLSCTNTPIQGRIRIIKKDQLTKEALAGAEFTVTRISGLPSHKGSNNGEVVAVIVTDADGIAVTPLLTWGTYRVEETKVPIHFVDNHYSTEVIIHEENLKTIEIEVENEPTKGWIRLTKTDRKNGNPIAGVQFDIYYNDQYGEGLVTTMVTDENGIAMSEPIRKGKYIVREHGETAGYLFEEVTLNCTVKSDEITDLSATNLPVQVKLHLFKRDKDEYTGNTADIPGTRGDGILTGAEFQLLAAENITDRQGNILFAQGVVVIASLKTAGTDASVITDELWPGVYEFIELTPPTGYQSTNAHVIVDASSAALQSTEAVITYEGVMKNEILYGCYGFIKFLGDNEIHDNAGLIEEPENGAVFEVFLKKAGSYDAARTFERDKITTDRYGKAKTKLLPYGVYTVKQIKGKKGYAIKSPFDIFIRGTEDPSNPPSLIINNEAVRYRLKFIKVDNETGKTILLANTAFKLKDGNGDYVTQELHYPTEKVIDTFYTDEEGTVTLPETVRRGLYFIEEVRAPEGYLINTDEMAIFVGDDNIDEPGEAYLLEFQIEDQPVKGNIILEKKGLQLTGFREIPDSSGLTRNEPIYEMKQLAGAVFEIHATEDIIGKDGTLWYEKDQLVETITTTAEGSDRSSDLPLGKYYLKEVSAPKDYLYPDMLYHAELVYADDHTPIVEISINADNDYIPAEIGLTKEKEILTVTQDGDMIRQILTNVPGEGFLFGLFNDTDIHYDNGTLLADSLIATGTTGGNGKLTFSGFFPHGKYYIRELFAPAGWKINTNRFDIVLDPESINPSGIIQTGIREIIHNELIWYPVTLTKLDITGEHTIPGAVIEVYNGAGEIIYRSSTDSNGQIADIPVVPGTYTFREILAPSGYALNEAVMTFEVDENGGITGETSIRDDYTRITLLKMDDENHPIIGVEFALVNEFGKTVLTAVSDRDGAVTFEKIPYGHYRVIETKALPGYMLPEIDVELTVDGTFLNPVEPITAVINEPIIVLVKKTDADGKPLSGSTFALCDSFNERVATVESDENGMLRFERIPYGEYTIREIIAPEGYLLNRDVIHLTVSKDWKNSDEPYATVINQRKRVKYIKVDTTGKFLPDVEFSLINASTGETVEVVTSNEKGEFIFTKFDYGFWKIVETKVPDGYSKMEDITLSVDNSWVEPEPFTCVNIPNYYEFMKVDNEDNPMAGVKFVLEDPEGNILRDDLVSGEDGIVRIDDLTVGTYIVRETETLEGFSIAGETIEFTIDEQYTVPDELEVLVNYPSIQTGVNFELTPEMIAGASIFTVGLGALIIALVSRNQKKRCKRRGKH